MPLSQYYYGVRSDEEEGPQGVGVSSFFFKIHLTRSRPIMHWRAQCRSASTLLSHTSPILWCWSSFRQGAQVVHITNSNERAQKEEELINFPHQTPIGSVSHLHSSCRAALTSQSRKRWHPRIRLPEKSDVKVKITQHQQQVLHI